MLESCVRAQLQKDRPEEKQQDFFERFVEQSKSSQLLNK